MSVQSQAIRHRHQLTTRKQQVLAGVAAGKTTKQLAGDLGVSAKNVEYHRLELMRQVDLFSYAELTKLAIRLGLATVDV